MERRAGVESHRARATGRVAVALSGGRGGVFDAVVGLTGYRPDLSFLSELALEVSPVERGRGAAGPRALASVTDCLSVPAVRRRATSSRASRASTWSAPRATGGCPRSCCRRARSSSRRSWTAWRRGMSTRRVSAAAFPQSPLVALDTLWFQVAGTLCNLQCTPLLHLLLAHQPRARDDDASATVRALPRGGGARSGSSEYYFTGGEPFLNRELLEMLEAALAQGPGLRAHQRRAHPAGDARRACARSPTRREYSLDLRVSSTAGTPPPTIPSAAQGTFERILAGDRAPGRARASTP